MGRFRRTTLNGSPFTSLFLTVVLFICSPKHPNPVLSQVNDSRHVSAFIHDQFRSTLKGGGADGKDVTV